MRVRCNQENGRYSFVAFFAFYRLYQLRCGYYATTQCRVLILGCSRVCSDILYRAYINYAAFIKLLPSRVSMLDCGQWTALRVEEMGGEDSRLPGRLLAIATQ